ncbi:MAG: hypothetical protein WCT44_01690 [Candidatus Paceibacterota bacterium]
MNKIKNITKGFLVLALLAGAFMATPVRAEDNNSGNEFSNARASLKADAMIRLDNSVGVVMGSNNAIRVMGAKVTAVSGNDISVTVPFGNSSLNFVVKTNTQTKVNGKLLSDPSVLALLKVGNKISFAGIISSSSSSSITVDGSHVVSQDLYSNGRPENKTSFQGEVKAINVADNSFTLKLKSGVSVKVALSSAAVITLDGTVKTLASLNVGDEVKLIGELNSDGTVITASKVIIDSNDDNNDNDNNGKNDEGKENKSWFGKFRNWFWN